MPLQDRVRRWSECAEDVVQEAFVKLSEQDEIPRLDVMNRSRCGLVQQNKQCRETSAARDPISATVSCKNDSGCNGSTGSLIQYVDVRRSALF